MRRALVLISLASLLIGCKPNRTLPGDSALTPPSSMTSLAAPMPSETKAPSIIASTATEVPSATIVPTMVPGSMRVEELQSLVDEWVNGDIPFDVNDRLLDERTAEPIRLGVLERSLENPVYFVFYNLGYAIVDDAKGEGYIINMAGFEDGKGNRFAFPLHNGTLSETCDHILLEKIEGLRINQGKSIYFKELKPAEFLLQSEDLQGRPTVAITWSATRGSGGTDCVKQENIYYEQSGETTLALSKFLGCNECWVGEMPVELSRFANIIPAEFSPLIPYARIYDSLGY